MEHAISRFRQYPSVAFSHCISADFGDRRHMSAGVAVVFSNSFGKPSARDCVSSHLTYQQKRNEAGVYGLVTKPVYKAKPTVENYNLAFDHLSKHFKEKELTNLICSPMGCLRDEIELYHFVANIIKFQKYTGATINILSHRKYWNKFRFATHEDFIKTLNTTLENSKKVQPKIKTTKKAIRRQLCSITQK